MNYGWAFCLDVKSHNAEEVRCKLSALNMQGFIFDDVSSDIIKVILYDTTRYKADIACLRINGFRVRELDMFTLDLVLNILDRNCIQI